MSTPVQTPFIRYDPMQVKTGTVSSLGLYLVLAHIFINYSRLPELMYIFIGTSFHIAMAFAVLGSFAVILTASFRRIFSSPITILMLVFTGWMMVCLPFAVWKGGTVLMLKKFWLLSLVTCFMISAMIVTLEDFRKTVYTIAAATLFIVFIGLISGSTTAQAGDVGRYGLEEGTLKNSNTLAAVLLIGMPFCLIIVWNERRGFRRIAAALGSVLIVLTVIRTGSRAGLITVAVLTVILFFHVPISKKVLMIMGIVLAGFIGVSLASRSALDRYRTLFSDDDQYVSEAELSASRSAAARKRLLVESLILTARHPLFGVGPGDFITASYQEAMRTGLVPLWRETHNTFTQLSSECGLPGFLLYTSALFLCFRASAFLRRATRPYPELRNIYNMAFALKLSLIAFTITAFFASHAYFVFFPMLAGITASFLRAAKVELAVLQAQAWKSAMPMPAARARSRAPLTAAPGRVPSM